MPTDSAILISEGKSFQSFGAEATKVWSPKVVKVLKFGSDVIYCRSQWCNIGMYSVKLEITVCSQTHIYVHLQTLRFTLKCTIYIGQSLSSEILYFLAFNSNLAWWIWSSLDWCNLFKPRIYTRLNSSFLRVKYFIIIPKVYHVCTCTLKLYSTRVLFTSLPRSLVFIQDPAFKNFLGFGPLSTCTNP